MSSFEYHAPAECFWRSPLRAAGQNIDGSQQRLRPFDTQLRTCALPKPSAHGLRSGMSASAVTKSNACTKTVSIRCGNLLSNKAQRDTENSGSFLGAETGFSTPTGVVSKKG